MIHIPSYGHRLLLLLSTVLVVVDFLWPHTSYMVCFGLYLRDVAGPSCGLYSISCELITGFWVLHLTLR